jgi:hypothetical protein
MHDDDLTRADERWCELADRRSAGEDLDEAELDLVRAHATDTPERAAESELLDALSQLAVLDPLTTSDRALARSVVAEFRDESGASGRVIGLRRSVAAGIGVVAGGLAAAAVVALMVDAPPAASPAAPEPMAVTAPAPAGPVLRSGRLLADDRAVLAGQTVPTGAWLTSDADGTCIDASVCADVGARLRLSSVDRLEVESGRVRVDGHLSRFTVVTTFGKVASDGGRYTLDVQRDTVVIAVLLGPVSLEDARGRTELRTGERFEWGTPAEPPATTEVAAATKPSAAPRRDPAPAAALPDGPAALLARAQELRGAGHRKQAAAAYHALLDAHPDSAEAHAAAVTLGNLELELQHPAAALRAFDRYLDRGGALAEEAAYGKIRALHRLGKTAELAAAIERFRREHPRSIYESKIESL